MRVPWASIVISAIIMAFASALFGACAAKEPAGGPSPCGNGNQQAHKCASPGTPPPTATPTPTPTAAPTPTGLPNVLFMYCNDDYKNGAVDVQITDVQRGCAVVETQLHASTGNGNGEDGGYQDCDPWYHGYKGWSNAQWGNKYTTDPNSGETPGPYSTPGGGATPTAAPCILLQHYQVTDFPDGTTTDTNCTNNDQPFKAYWMHLNGSTPDPNNPTFVGNEAGDTYHVPVTGGGSNPNSTNSSYSAGLRWRIDKKQTTYPGATPSPCPKGGSDTFTLLMGTIGAVQGATPTPVEAEALGCINGIQTDGDNGNGANSPGPQVKMYCPAAYNDAGMVLNDNCHTSINRVAAQSTIFSSLEGVSDSSVIGGPNTATPGPGQQSLDSQRKMWFDVAKHSFVDDSKGSPGFGSNPPPWAGTAHLGGAAWTFGCNQLQDSQANANVSPLALDQTTGVDEGYGAGVTNGSINDIWHQGELMFENVNANTRFDFQNTQIPFTLNTASVVEYTSGSNMIFENHHVNDYSCQTSGNGNTPVPGFAACDMAGSVAETNMLADEMYYYSVFFLYYKQGAGTYPQTWFSLQIKSQRFGGQCSGDNVPTGATPATWGNCHPVSVWPIGFLVPDDNTVPSTWLETMQAYCGGNSINNADANCNFNTNSRGTGCATGDKYSHHGTVDLLASNDGTNGATQAVPADRASTSCQHTTSLTGGRLSGLLIRQGQCWQNKGDPLGVNGAPTNIMVKIPKCASIVNTGYQDTTVPCHNSVGSLPGAANGVGDMTVYSKLLQLSQTGPMAVGSAHGGSTDTWPTPGVGGTANPYSTKYYTAASTLDATFSGSFVCDPSTNWGPGKDLGGAYTVVAGLGTYSTGATTVSGITSQGIMVSNTQ